MKFTDGEIAGIDIQELSKFTDERGWLSEIYRADNLPEDTAPVMAYMSMTKPGIGRGPHGHHEQTDRFVFYSSEFKVELWDNREDSPTYGKYMTVMVGKDAPMLLVVPPGIVHGYSNVGQHEGMVLNLPNKLYAGKCKQEPVDEIRFEDDDGSHFKLSP